MAEQTSSFSDLYGFDKNAGIVIVDTAEVKTAVEAMMERVFGTDVDMTEETPMGRFVEALTVLMTQTLSINAQNANQYNINTATGNYLDAIGALFGISRRAATKTRVEVVVTGTSGTTIPTTCIAESLDGHQFNPEESITIGENGTAVGFFVATESGPVPCEKETLTIISSGVTGWSSINNNTDTPNEYGADIESDFEYRNRILASRSRGSASVEAITNAIYASDTNVKSACVLENGYGQPITKKGVTIPPHSIFVCVYGGDNEKIADAIFKTKTAGAGYTYSASPVENVTDVTVVNSGVSYHVFFFRPANTSISFNVEVNKYLYEGAVNNLELAVKNALAEYCRTSGIGATITKEGAVEYLASRIPSIRIISLSMGYSGDSSSTDTIELAANRIAYSNESNITVTGLETT